MRYNYLLAVVLSCIFLVGCGVDQSEYDKVKKERDDLDVLVTQKDNVIKQLRDTITMLSYPASDRLLKVNNLISQGKYDEARSEMNQLASLFPNSQEAHSIPAISIMIDGLIAKQKAEEERIKALGFKGIKTVSTTTIEYNKVSFSNVSVGSTFEFDDYGSHYRYRKADRGDVYVTASMSVTSSSKNPDLPTLAVYSIKGDRMNREGIMEVRFSQWKDYGTYLGNSSDYGNDFAKTSTIQFKLGVEISSEITQKPYAVVLKKSNGLSRKYDRYENPPVSYSGSVSYPYILSLDDFTKENSQYIIIKIANLK